MDELMQRYIDLSLMQNIPDMGEYAEDWFRLGNAMQDAGRFSSAATCYDRSNHYREMSGGEYVRLIDQPFAELIEVPG
jgi:hypothetical protein